jgi:hypothetical protein
MVQWCPNVFVYVGLCVSLAEEASKRQKILKIITTS